jgi:hypothetical protein
MRISRAFFATEKKERFSWKVISGLGFVGRSFFRVHP